jgi:hypothetical protein
MPLTYTYSFHALGCASVAQRQSTGFVNQWLWVQIPPLASLAGKSRQQEGPPAKRVIREVTSPPGKAIAPERSLKISMDGQMAERPMASDCKSDGLSPTGVRIPLCPLFHF